MNYALMPFVNNWAMTEQAARDVLAQTLPDVRLLLIDNGSDQETRAACQQFVTGNPSVLAWYHTPALPSLAATWNRALRFVWESGGAHAWVVNNDVRLHPTTYSTLVRTVQETGAWFVSGVGVTAEQFHLTDLTEADQADALSSRGGPDFSCYLITKECHRWFQFDESFIPAYHEDNDYHRRLQLAGFGDRVFGVNLPFLHYGSATINQSKATAEAFRPKFEACREYYIQKWGGVPGSETFDLPFNPRETPEDLRAVGGDPRQYMTGQGKPPWLLKTEELFHG